MFATIGLGWSISPHRYCLSRRNASDGAPPPRTRGYQMPLLLIVSLAVIGGLALLLGGLVLLVVCSGINNLSDDAPRPGAGGASRSECPWQRLPKN